MKRLLLILVLTSPAWARLGGGESYSGGGSSSSSGGDGGDILILLDLLEMVIRLVVYYPQVGVPLLLGVGGWLAYHYYREAGQRAFEVGRDWSSRQTPVRQGSETLEKLRAVDPNFSRPIFLDFMALLYTRARSESIGAMAGLKAYLAPDVAQALQQQASGLQAIDQVIVGSIRLTRAEVSPDVTRLTVALETNYRTLDPQGAAAAFYCVEDWTLQRRTGVLSKGPDEALTLACPACGNPGEMSCDGNCPYCGQKVNTGRFDWLVTRVQVRRQVPKVTLPLSPEGDEVGSDLSTRCAPNLDPQRQALEARDPSFQWEAFDSRVRHIFLNLQQAWSDQDEEAIRPYETDSLFSSHRYWISAYREQGLQNRIEDVVVGRAELVRIELDAFYEAISVRIFAHLKDFTLEVSSGRVVSGSPDRVSNFSEYWTFIRRVGARRGGDYGGDRCPSCGAPLDRIGMTGICGYCNRKVTRGEFDWVLSLIEQDEAYES